MNMTFDTFHHFLIILIACFRLYHFEVTSITLLEVKVTLTIETGKRVIMTCLESQNSPRQMFRNSLYKFKIRRKIIAPGP